MRHGSSCRIGLFEQWWPIPREFRVTDDDLKLDSCLDSSRSFHLLARDNDTGDDQCFSALDRLPELCGQLSLYELSNRTRPMIGSVLVDAGR